MDLHFLCWLDHPPPKGDHCANSLRETGKSEILSGSAVMRQQPWFKCGMAIVVMLLTLRGSAPAQTPIPRPTPSATPPRVARLKVAVQLEREQNDPILMTVIYAAQYAPVYEALVEEDPWHNFVPMLATDWSMSPDGKTWTFNLRKGVQWHFGWGEFTVKDVV